jgi:DNA repair exonuclease SbcCD ATPase subunit
MKNLIIFFLFLNCLYNYSQTVGIGEVTSIESKAKKIQENKNNIKKHQNELPELEKVRKDKIAKLNDEIAALIKERDDLIADMKVGARCSECGTWKSEFEKRGVNFQQHLGEVQGYAVPATTSELEVTRKNYSEKIAIKKVQIKNLEKGDDVQKKMMDIAKLEDNNLKLCEEIRKHSSSYEQLVFNDAKAKHKVWIDNLLSTAVNFLISSDKISIYQSKYFKADQDFIREKDELADKIKVENENKQKLIDEEIKKKLEIIDQMTDDMDERIAVYEKQLYELNEQLEILDRELKSLENQQKEEKLNDRIKIEKQIDVINESVTSLETETDKNIQILKDEISSKEQEILILKTGLSSKQNAEIQKLKLVYENKKSEIKKMELAATADLETFKSTFSNKEDEYTKSNNKFTSIIQDEQSRIIASVQNVDCLVRTEANGKVVSNWSSSLSCVKSLLTSAKPYSTNIFNAYCKDQNLASYMSAYKSFVRDLSPDDIEVVKSDSNADWFEKMVN